MEERKKILIVEDDPILKELLEHELVSKYSLAYANDGEEALTAFERVRPDLVLLDLMLPKLDGFAVLDRIRGRSDELKQVPIIVLSNLDQESDERRVRSAGANEYLIKANIAVEEILNHIRAFLTPAA